MTFDWTDQDYPTFTVTSMMNDVSLVVTMQVPSQQSKIRQLILNENMFTLNWSELDVVELDFDIMIQVDPSHTIFSRYLKLRNDIYQN